jgi:hypothetical protein
MSLHMALSAFLVREWAAKPRAGNGPVRSDRIAKLDAPEGGLLLGGEAPSPMVY